MMTSFLSMRRRVSPKILSSDGEWIGWLDGMQIVIRNVENVKPETRVDLSSFGPASYVLSNIDMRSGEIMLSRNAEFMVLGTDGAGSFKNSQACGC